VVFSYACHPVIVYGYAFAAISPDFPGVAREVVREALGQKGHVQFVQGFAGNIRPRVVADLANGRFRAPKPEDLRQAGTDLGNAVLSALKSKGESLSLNIAGAADRPFLPRANPPPRESYEKLRAEALAKTNKFQIAVCEYWLQRYDSGEGFARGDAWSLGLIRLANNQWIVHSGGEPCVEWRGKISQWLAPLNIVTWGYSQEAKSYLLPNPCCLKVATKCSNQTRPVPARPPPMPPASSQRCAKVCCGSWPSSGRTQCRSIEPGLQTPTDKLIAPPRLPQLTAPGQSVGSVRLHYCASVLKQWKSKKPSSRRRAKASGPFLCRPWWTAMAPRKLLCESSSKKSWRPD